MHDPNPNPKKRMPPLVVLGLTGPVGSGCSTVSSRVFDDPDTEERGEGNELLNVLRFVKWVGRRKGEDGFGINWKGFNAQVDNTHEQLALVRKATRRLDTYKAEDAIPAQDFIVKLREEVAQAVGDTLYEAIDFGQQLARLESRLRKKLNDELETREAIKALDKLNAYYRKDTHLFRTISVSDLIVYRCLMAIEKEKFNIDDVPDPSKRGKYRHFLAVAMKHMRGCEAEAALGQAGVATYADYYKRCYDYDDETELGTLSGAFYGMHNIARTVKREFSKTRPYDYAEIMQDFGDNIRRCDDPFGIRSSRMPDSAYKLAKGLAQMIYILYRSGRGAFFVVDCLRNPYEVIYLRREFANFFLLSLYAERSIRRRRFVKRARRMWGRQFNKKRVTQTFKNIDERDAGKNVQGDELLYKQNVTKCVQISDIAINNEEELIDAQDPEIVRRFCSKPLRILCLILSPGCTKPNDDEMCMNMAYAMAVKSNCISRQVGAVIVGPKGYVVGAGWNDVAEGKISCGLRAIRDLPSEEFRPHVKALLGKEEKDRVKKNEVRKLVNRLRDMVKGANRSILPEQFCFCFKDGLAKKIVALKINEARDKINSGADEKDKLTLGVDDTNRLVAKMQIHELEYCLALHAEENAIIQSSKIGGMGLKGGAVYTTAQPCPLCAKKIQQIGLHKVVYTDPYPESLAGVYMKGVDLQQFEGVKPRAYIKLFMPHHDQKEWQALESQNLVPAI